MIEDAQEASSSSPKPKEVAHDESPAIISDHKFSPMGEWYTRCRICRLAEAAHAESEKIGYYDDDDD